MRPGRVRTGVTLALALLAGLGLAAPTVGSAASPAVGDTTTVAADGCPVGELPKRQLRGTWIASVSNINWPSRTGLTAAAQQAELRSLLDQAKALRLNAVFLQIRPAADAFWPSPYEPWSQYLTGTQGGNPGYDPLAFAVTEAHARNLELHGWFNPYRVSTQPDVTKLAAGHPARTNPTWVERYDGKLFYNPGVPAARRHTVDAIMDAVSRYDLDGVHFDDYFYPYPVSGQVFDDAAEYAAHGAGRSLADWRRANVDTMVQEVAARIRQVKPHVRFGISPFGIWRNASTDPLGSATSGLQSYDAIYADSRRWVKQGWVDYLAPQLYWPIGFTAAPYEVLVPWWSDVVAGTDVQLYVGQATYRIPTWGDPEEMPRHLVLNRDHRVSGDIHYSVKELLANPLGFADRLRTDFYRNPALVPVNARLGGTAPYAPTGLTARRTATGIELSWTAGTGGTAATYFAVYRADGAGCGIEAGRNLIAVPRAVGTGTQRFTDPAPPPVGEVTYLVTAVSRLHHESTPTGVNAPH
ncbi:family 10 glycosylhydrolase [Micromonospora echinofusca]|uniref:Family 10 glycosylhydrolase n=1 Tax=Micromonospora echinofusca TaxID=47858 RepID=A0ABS3VUY2_MICEH|nr:family 10 glycosylhydrolase [Micromonospora echinofusca]